MTMTVRIAIAAVPSLEKRPAAAAPHCSDASTASTASTAGGDSSSSSVVGNAADPVTYWFDDIECKYRVDHEVIGSGHQGTARVCTDRATGERRAVKTVRKSAGTNDLAGEIALLHEMNHWGIVRLVDVFEDSENVHLVTDLCEGGELFDRIEQRASERAEGEPCFEEGEARGILRQVLEAVSYMHANDVVHRDIKPENILFETEDDDSPIKVIDFGLAQKHRGGDPLMKRIDGTPYYIAPEVLRGSYDRSCDLWSVGVLAYILLTGYPPFDGEDDKEIYKAVRKGKFSFDTGDWKNISSEAMDFVHGLLRKQPKKRMTADEALSHPWIAGCIDTNSKDAKGAGRQRVVPLDHARGGPGASRKVSSLCGRISKKIMSGRRLFKR